MSGGAILGPLLWREFTLLQPGKKFHCAQRGIGREESAVLASANQKRDSSERNLPGNKTKRLTNFYRTAMALQSAKL
jgi:hypothetical protein